MVSAQCLILACLLTRSLAFEDAEALFQQRQAVTSQVVLSADKSAALSSWGPRPDNTLKGMRMTRLTSTGTGDNIVLLTTTMHCEESDSRGPKTCVFPFYVPFATYLKIKVPMFVSATDYVVVKYSSMLSYNSSTWMGMYLPRQQSVTATCQLCSASCIYSITNVDYSLNVTTPTILGSLGVCDGKKQSMIFIKKQCAILPRPTEELALGGNMRFGLALFGEDDSVKAESSYLITAAKSEWTTINTTAATAASAAASLARAVETESLVEKTRPSFGMTDLMQELLSGMAHRRKRAASSSKHDTKRLSAGTVMTFNLTLMGIAASNALTFMLSSGCSVLQGGYYALTCKVPVNADVSVTSTAQISFDAKPGAKIFWGQQLQASTEYMEKLPMYFQQFSMEAPLCGEGRSKAKAKAFASMPSIETDYTPPECGSYAFSFSTDGAKPVNWNQYLDMLLPFGQEPPADSLPLSKTMWLKMTDDAGASILDVEFSIRLE